MRESIFQLANPITVVSHSSVFFLPGLEEKKQQHEKKKRVVVVVVVATFDL
jgi:hypothetical protein